MVVKGRSKKPFWQRIHSGTWAIGAVFLTTGLSLYYACVEPFQHGEEYRLKQLMLRSQMDKEQLSPQGNLPEWSSPYLPKK